MIIQMNHYVCDKCGNTVIITKQTFVGSDPVVETIPDWDFDDKDICPKCSVKVIK